MITDKELAEGGYRFDDLVEHRIVSGRSDLDRKQKKYGFPKPVKTGNRQSWFTQIRGSRMVAQAHGAAR